MSRKSVKKFIHDYTFNLYSRLAFCLARIWYPFNRNIEKGEPCDIPVPFGIGILTNSQCAISHGAALNWVYYHVLRKMKPKRFALIDHDIFPVKSYNLTSALGEKDFYGVRRSGNGEWYLWPGWCIFNFTKFTARPNFEPIFTQKSFLDTGGSNYPRYYYRYDIQVIPFPRFKSFRYKKTEGLNRHCDILHSDYIQIVDESWLHLINGSNYAKIPGKEDMISRILSDTSQFWDTIQTAPCLTSPIPSC